MNPRVLVVEDDVALCGALGDTLSLSGFDPVCTHDGNKALDVLQSRPVDLVISDVQMAGLDGIELLRELKSRYASLPVLLMTAYGTIRQAVEAMQLGAADYLIKPFEAEVLVSKVSSLLDTGTGGEQDLIACDPVTEELVALARQVAATDVTVCITGESGTGKEVFARFLHRHSNREGHPFVAINCAAIPENMLEAILFGHEKGAFTGAYKSCPGKFEQAQNGTLLLDEISEMDLGLQAKLLRVLQERKVERLGGRQLIDLNVRVLASSNQDLTKAVEDRRFREDLFYRLNVFPLQLPALRERVEDILPLARHFLRQAAAGARPPELSEQACEALRQHAWPGNVRELDNVMQRAYVLQPSTTIQPAITRHWRQNAEWAHGRH